MEDPAQYIKFNYNVKKDVKDVIEEYRTYMEWTNGERILDIGSGPGDVTSQVLIPYLPEDALVVGCDSSDCMVTFGKHVYSNSQLSFRKLDIEQKYMDITRQLKPFDKVFSFYCLHWVHDHRTALENIYSLLNNNGYAFLMFLTPENPSFTILKKLKNLQKWEKFTKGVQWFYECEDPQYYNELLKDAGFNNIECYVKKTFHHYVSIENFLRLLQTVDPSSHKIPNEIKSEYHQDMKDILIQENPFEYDEVNQRYVTEYKHIVAIAKKHL